MKNPKFWWSFIAFLVAWSIFETYPPTSRNLVQEFQEQADSAKVDTNFTRIVAQAEALEKANSEPQEQFGNLMKAIGTNDIRPYFPYIDVHADDHPTYAILNALQKKAAGKIKLGLDLQGGTEFRVSLDTNHMVATDTNGNKVAMRSDERLRLVSQAAEVLRHRVDNLGVAEPVIQADGEDHIIIQLPGLSQAAQDEAKKNIQKAAFLEFRLVHPDSDKLIKEGVIEPGYAVLTLKRKNSDGTTALVPYLVQKKLANGLTGKYIKRAYPNRDTMGAPEIDFEFDSEGAKKFDELTRDHIGEQLAIVLDGELDTAPVIQGEIPAGRGVITGSFPIEEAITIANVLENPLETPVSIDAMKQVDPTLGKDSISSGIRAAIYGTLLVAAFMAFYYHRCGVIADIAMVLNLLILLGVMCSIGTTLTLPGIAGVVLTVGMAVDANVLIYERLREEMAQGKSMRGAIAAAYSRAFSTIFDSHTTTLISAVILIYLGTGPVKGFGVTLTIGVALSLFTSLVMTRLIFNALLARGWLNHIGMLHIIKNPHWDFMKFAKVAFATSWIIILIGMSYGIFVRGAKVMGIDFAGGDSITMSFKQKVDVDKLRAALAKVGDTQIQYQKGADQDMLEVVAPLDAGPAITNASGIVTYDPSAAVTNALAIAFPNAGFHAIGSDVVGPTVGVEIQKSAIMATFLSLFGILLYVAFRYEFSFSVGAVLAVIHDVLMTLGIFFLSGRQLSAPMVAAVLTIIGFSINDTIVIFDRIREDLKLGVRGSFKDVMNIALNQTLSRTLITSGTVFIATMSLYIWGGGVINDFAFTFLVGIITGTYSSIYIASALVLWWHKGERPKSASQVVMEAASGARARLAPAMPDTAPITIWQWGAFIVIILILLGLDLGVFHRSARVVKPKEALLWGLAWFVLAMLFAGGLAVWRGPGDSLEFITGYFVEFSLSMDNVVAIALIFTSFSVAPRHQHRLLFWGILGALVMRGLMIGAGTALIQNFRWVLYVMGAFLIATGVKWGVSRQAPALPAKNPVLRLARKIFPISDEYDGKKFLTWKDGRRAWTPLALVLLLVETTDLIFAVDSIPAIFAVTQKAFIVFTSNVFAILGLRSLYFAVAGAIQYFRYLKAGLAGVLVFVGVKMLATPWFVVPTSLSLAVVAVIIGCSIWLSVLAMRKEKRR